MKYIYKNHQISHKKSLVPYENNNAFGGFYTWGYSIGCSGLSAIRERGFRTLALAKKAAQNRVDLMTDKNVVKHPDHGYIKFSVLNAGIAGDPFKLFEGRKVKDNNNTRFTVLINNDSLFTPIYKWWAKKKILNCFEMLM